MPDDFAQDVKRQVDIVKIVGDYLRLKKSGAQNFSGLCPFHKEKSPSFSVNSVKQIFYCFGCHEHGDVFTFVMKMESITFPEAVRAVAGKAGIALPKREFASPEEAREAGIRRQLLDLHEAATQYFEGMLKSPEAARAREYLTGRGVSGETIQRFRIGYAPESFNDMRDRLGKHFGEEALRASGLFSAKENADGTQGQMYARFRRRITFPIMNEQGKPIAFTARALEENDEKGRPTAKYINSPETGLYTKGQVLFNLDKAKSAIKTHDFALLVEGQMDCISVYMAGVQNVVATSGTAFTEVQARLLARFTHRVVLNFDPDEAGLKAATRVIEMLAGEDFEIKIVTLEGGLDPDRYVREKGVQAYMLALRGAVRYSDYLIERVRQEFPGRTAESNVKAMNALLPHIRRMPNALQRNAFAMDAAQKLGIDSGIFLQEIKQAAARRVESLPSKKAEPLSETEAVLLRALILPDGDAARELAAERLGGHPEWFEGLPAGGLMEVLTNGPAPENPLEAAPDVASRSMLARVMGRGDDVPAGEGSFGARPRSLVEEVEGALLNLERRAGERRQRDLRTMLAEAERRGDGEMSRRLEVELMDLMRRLRDL
jgi:DNA primase